MTLIHPKPALPLPPPNRTVRKDQRPQNDTEPDRSRILFFGKRPPSPSSASWPGKSVRNRSQKPFHIRTILFRNSLESLTSPNRTNPGKRNKFLPFPGKDSPSHRSPGPEPSPCHPAAILSRTSSNPPFHHNQPPPSRPAETIRDPQKNHPDPSGKPAPSEAPGTSSPEPPVPINRTSRKQGRGARPASQTNPRRAPKPCVPPQQPATS